MGLSPSRHSLFSGGQQSTGESERGFRRNGERREEEEEMPQLRKREKGEPVQQRSRKRGRIISSCTSPRPTFLTRHSEFVWYEEDLWTEVAKYLDGPGLVRLGAANRWFHRLMMEESIWKYACLRDLQVPPPRHMSFKWLHLYTSAFGGSHSYTFRQQEKHIDWMRIGAFYFDSPVAVLTEKLPLPKKLQQQGEDPVRAMQTSGTYILSNTRTGIWIADLQLVRCPVCNLNTCEGTMQILDARHAELFLEEGYQKGRWDYEEIGAHRTDKPSTAATGGIFDIKHITSPCTAGVLDVKSWAGKPDDWQPKARVCLHSVAINTNLQPNEGLHVRFQVMRSGGPDGEVVSIRISQQLV